MRELGGAKNAALVYGSTPAVKQYIGRYYLLHSGSLIAVSVGCNVGDCGTQSGRHSMGLSYQNCRKDTQFCHMPRGGNIQILTVPHFRPPRPREGLRHRKGHLGHREGHLRHRSERVISDIHRAGPLGSREGPFEPRQTHSDLKTILLDVERALSDLESALPDVQSLLVSMYRRGPVRQAFQALTGNSPPSKKMLLNYFWHYRFSLCYQK